MIILLTLAAILAGCSQFPALEDSVSPAAKNAPFPALVPVEDIQARAAPEAITPETLPGVEARVARLKARASRLRGSVLDRPSRERLAQPVE